MSMTTCDDDDSGMSADGECLVIHAALRRNHYPVVFFGIGNHSRVLGALDRQFTDVLDVDG
jgi:hypothetical protein